MTKRRRFDKPSKALKTLKQIIVSLESHDSYTPFAEPVDPDALNIPDYFDIVKHPMDLGTIKEKIDKNEYNNDIDRVVADIAQVWENCYLFNPPESDYCTDAEKIQKMVAEKMKKNVPDLFQKEHVDTVLQPEKKQPRKEEEEEEEEEEKSGPDEEENSSAEEATNTGAGAGVGAGAGTAPDTWIETIFSRRAPNLDLDKILTNVPPEQLTVPLSAEEKNVLMDILDGLAPEYFSNVLTFVANVSPQTAKEADKDTVEIDIEAMDVRVQRSLFQFLKDCQAVMKDYQTVNGT